MDEINIALTLSFVYMTIDDFLKFTMKRLHFAKLSNGPLLESCPKAEEVPRTQNFGVIGKIFLDRN